MVPIVADAEAGFGGNLNAYKLMRSMIEAGAAGVHFEDQLASEKKCGHLGGKVLVPTSQFIRTLIAARLAADACDVPTVIIARTDALSAQLITSDVDPYDAPYVSKVRTPEGFYRLAGDDMERTIARGLAYAPYADMLWFETSEPNIDQAQQFASAIHAKFPGKLLAYNCSPSFNWKKKLNAVKIGKFQEKLGEMGYAFQFITRAGFHSISLGMFKLAHMYSLCGMTAYADLQDEEFRQEENGYTATRHQREVGTGYFDVISQIVSSGQSSTLALEGSTEQEQFKDEDREHQGF
jgi:isocitrate lyase